MKRFWTHILCILCMICVLAACGVQEPVESSSTEDSSQNPESVTSPEDSSEPEETEVSPVEESSECESSEEASVESSETSPEESSEEVSPEESSADDSETTEETSTEETDVGLQQKNKVIFSLSSIFDVTGSDCQATYLVTAPYTDTYTFQCTSTTEMAVYDANGEVIATGTDSMKAKLKKNDKVYISVTTAKSQKFTLNVSRKNNTVELPFAVQSGVDASSYATTSDSSENPLTACEISYVKRSSDRSLYINCNNPEALSENDLNQCLTSNDVTNKDVFFTFEHNNIKDVSVYYGYRVTNTGDEDLYITVKNLGLQLDGAGSWLGEDEWVKFYNMNFKVDTSSYTASQMKNFDAYMGFSGKYSSEDRQPITYCIPSGSYIYVMGGTASDAYQKINVFSSAGKTVTGGCSNGSVLFSTYGSTAKGEFVVYNLVSTLNANLEKKAQQGYVGNSQYGSQYVGSEDIYGVVDADFVWTFNDSTPAGALPVSFSNPYFLPSGLRTGTRYSEIAPTRFQTKTYTNARSWTTHINPNNVENAVGTDMTKYETIDSVTGQEVTIDYLHYDGKGNTSNIGNWMVDYIDTFTLVNQGDKDRTFSYKIQLSSGSILAFVRDENGNVVEDAPMGYFVYLAKSTYGDAIDDNFVYTVTVPAHSVLRFSVDYNLLANSTGTIQHFATLQ